jgi:hypothetical protein
VPACPLSRRFGRISGPGADIVETTLMTDAVEKGFDSIVARSVRL